MSESTEAAAEIKAQLTVVNAPVASCRVCGPVCLSSRRVHKSGACKSGLHGGCTGYTEPYDTYICDCPCHDDRFGCPCEEPS